MLADLHTHGSDGYGHAQPALRIDQARGIDDDAVQLLGIDDSLQARTQVTIAEVGGAAAKIEVLDVDANGTTRRTEHTLAANAVLTLPAAQPPAGINRRIAIRVLEGEGRVVGFALRSSSINGDGSVTVGQ